MNAGREPSSTRNDVEPTAGSAHAPVWLFVLLALLCFWGMGYLDNRAGGFNPEVYAPYPSYEYVADSQPRSAGNDTYDRGKRVYDVYCNVCHQQTGQGLPFQFPPLAASDWVLTPGPNRLIRLVLDGGQGTITVNGQPFTGAMPPWKGLLTDENVADVLTFIRQNKAWGNNASPVTVEQVKVIRDKEASRNIAWDPEDLLKLPDSD